MFLLALIGLAAFFLYKKLTKKKDESPLHVKEWKKDVVYLLQVPVSPHVRTLSPFALKLETWLRMTNTPYETLFTLKMSSKGQTPFIEYNGQQYPDSNLIIKFLKKELKVDPDGKLDENAKATTHAVQVMVENHTAMIGFYWRYGHHYQQIWEKGLINIPELPKFMVVIMKQVMPYTARFRFYLQGIARHSFAEIDQFSFDDLQSISQILGQKKFFCGDEPTTIDCTLFGHLAQFLYLPLDFPQKEFMKKECKNLVEYVDRVRDKFWPDWKEMCDEKCMEGKKSTRFM